jgi:hypothetical protein
LPTRRGLKSAFIAAGRIDRSTNADRRPRIALTINAGMIGINSWPTACDDAEEASISRASSDD